jgi:lysophospholipase L1-like esterase
MFKGGLYLALGDSVTWQNYESGATGDDLYATKLSNWIKANYGNIRHINKGIGGTTTIKLLTDGSWWSRLVPDLVTIGIGMNDCVNDGVTTAVFTTNLNTIIDSLRRRNKNVVIILCAPNSTTEATRTSYVASYRTAMSNVATAKNCAYCDFSQAFTTGQIATYTTDNIHPNKAGHGKLFDVLLPVAQSAAANWLNSLGK